MEAMKGRGEVRKVNVLYFISREGKVEHPHLIRVHQFRGHGVRLRDVKRWLSALRGDGMPDSFSWSYKRRYKSEYVWQDLTEDDLITPISDNEYILKGSELIMRFDQQARVQKFNASFSSGKTVDAFGTSNSPESGASLSQDTSDESSIISIVSKKYEKDVLNTGNEIVIDNKNMEHTPQDNNRNFRTRSCNKNNSHISGKKASRVLRNLMHCGTVDISDSTLRPVKPPVTGRQVSIEVMSQRRSLGGDARYHEQKQRDNSSHSFSNARKKSSSNESQRRSYRPAAEPKCSQCGNKFKPEKLHLHMNSCKVLREKKRTWKRIQLEQRNGEKKL
ncbi:Protein SOSEKI 2 plant protein [Dioscorea alata]|uniref:Protein SOSEKI 2 plant protein n=1 Tax=Dioscorea alata TaxID=55571 RepID=A0ACB7UYQ0_DIOAL|nr:Protein SOSEKI 2 plant protein [Dioscorea alata]